MKTLSKFLFWVLLCASVSAYPQHIRSNRAVISSSSGVVTSTTAPLSLFVATTGSDTNDCLTVGTPCLTIQAAENKVPKYILHPVTITLGAGTFAGAVIAGHTVLPPSGTLSTTYSYHFITGTQANAVPASTGSSSGTATSVSAASGATFFVLNDTNNNMTVNEYAGKYLKITSGTGSTPTVARPGPYWLIISNTATAFTLVGSGNTNAAAASGYQVVSPSTVIASAVTPATGTGSPALVASVFGPTGLAYSQNIGTGFAVSNIEFTLGASLTRGITTGENRIRVMHSRFIGGASTVAGITSNATTNLNSGAELFGVYMSFSSGVGTMYSSTSTGGTVSLSSPSLISNYFTGGLNQISIGGTAAGPTINNCYLKSPSAVAVLFSGVNLAQVINSRIDGAASGIQVQESATAGLGMSSFGVTTTDISNCTVAGVDLQGAFASAYLSTVSGTLNAIGLKIARGAKTVVTASSTLTGTIEVSIDAVSNDYATMRAATPKIISNASYGTAYYQ